jgi:hypothetical protein
MADVRSRVKRSKKVKLFLIGSLSAGALTGCSPSSPSGPAPISSDNVYPDNYYVSGVGYYHAPFRAWYPLPFNHFDAARQQYYYGGQWAATPLESITNVSSPSQQVADLAEASRTDIARGGFGGTYGHGGFFFGGG